MTAGKGTTWRRRFREPALIVIVVALWGAGMASVPGPWASARWASSDDLRQDLGRYEALRPLVGETGTVWMYVDPGQRPGRVARRSRGQDFKAQYALAPVVVRPVGRQEAVEVARVVADYRLIVFARSRDELEALEHDLGDVVAELGGSVTVNVVDDHVVLLRSRHGP